MNFNKKYLSIIALVAVIASLFFGIAITASAQSSSSEQQDPQRMVAEIYAKHYGVTIDVAILRLELQESFPDLGPALESSEQETFGGLWIQHEPEYKIVVAFTHDGEKTIANYNKYIPAKVSPYIEVKKVNRSLVELISDQDKLLTSLKSQGIQVNSRVDVINNCVSLDVTKSDENKFNAARQNDKLDIPSNLKINFVEGLAVLATDIYGGLTLQQSEGGGDFGTSGFAVVNSAGTKGIATAAHLLTVVYYNGVFLPVQNPRLYYGSWDCQWHICPGLTVQNKVKYSSAGYTISILATKSRDAQNIGDVVSKYGMTTGYTVGQITSKTAVLDVPLTSPTWIEVSNTYGYPKMAERGDSGGPWFTFTGGTAYGITSSVSTDRQKAYYMAVNYLSNIGVSVMTSP